MGVPHISCRCVAVNVHCGPDVCVPHELLLYADRSTHRVQPSAVSVPECVRTEVAYPSLPGSVAQVLPHEAVAQRLKPELVGRRGPGGVPFHLGLPETPDTPAAGRRAGGGGQATVRSEADISKLAREAGLLNQGWQAHGPWSISVIEICQQVRSEQVLRCGSWRSTHIMV